MSAMDFIRKSIFCFFLLLSKRKEPYFSFKYLIQYLIRGDFYYGAQLRKNSIEVNPIVSEDFIIIEHSGRRFHYPNNSQSSAYKAVRNFQNVILEQSTGHPHRYSYELVQPDWVVYDLGAAEGYQIDRYLTRCKKVIAFEPDPFFVRCLLKTFHEEVKDGRLVVINCGISDDIHSGNFSPTLTALINNYQLPFPDYIKADIEGDEMQLLQGLGDVIKQHLLALIEITTYHKPEHCKSIPAHLSKYSGSGSFTPGVIMLNIDRWTEIGNYKHIFHPVFRKVLYRYNFQG